MHRALRSRSAACTILRAMLQRCLEAYAQNSSELAKQVPTQAEELDGLFAAVVNQTIEEISKNVAIVTPHQFAAGYKPPEVADISQEDLFGQVLVGHADRVLLG